MEPGTVVVTWPGFDPTASPGAGDLRRAGLRIRLEPKTGARSPAEVAAIMAGAMGAVVSTDPFDRDVIAALPDLRVIARVGVGTDSIDLAAAAEAGVVVTTTPGANEEVVADHALALILALVRRVTEHDASVRAGRWDRLGALTPGQLHGRTVGVVGYGTIGRAVAARLAGFGVQLLVHDPALGPDGIVGGRAVPLDELLAGSDIVTLHVPLTPETRGLLDAAAIARLPVGAIVVNTARGGLIDEGALAEALDSGRLGGVGLDVFETEPPAPSALLAHPRVVRSPHVAGLSHASIAEMTARACASVAAVALGEPVRDALVAVGGSRA